MIANFKNKESEKIFNGIFSKKFPVNIQQKAKNKLEEINAAIKVEDLMIPPGNKLERLVGNRKGQYSIRINKKWRICFIFHNGHAYDVEILDYH